MGDIFKSLVAELDNANKRIAELEAQLKTAKADAIDDMITHLECRFTITTKSKRIIDYANSLVGEE